MRFTKAVSLGKNGLLKKIPNSDLFEVRQEFIWYLDYNNKKEFVIVPKGFRTNFGSIPRILRFFFNPVNYVSYILHDYLYTKKSFIYVGEFQGREPKRKETDYMLLEALNIEGAGTIEKLIIYIGVRRFGFLFFKK